MRTEQTLARVWDQHVGAEFGAHSADEAVAWPFDVKIPTASTAMSGHVPVAEVRAA